MPDDVLETLKRWPVASEGPSSADAELEPGAYLTKVGEVDEPHQTPGFELARMDRKVGRAWGSRSPFAILADHAHHRRVSDWRLFEEWLLVSKGRSTLMWSRGLRAELLPGVDERTDEEIAAESEAATALVTLAPPVWREVVNAALSVAVLQAVEARGLRGVVDLLAGAGVEVVLDVARDGRGPRRISRPPPGWARRQPFGTDPGNDDSYSLNGT